MDKIYLQVLHKNFTHAYMEPVLFERIKGTWLTHVFTELGTVLVPYPYADRDWIHLISAEVFGNSGKIK